MNSPITNSPIIQLELDCILLAGSLKVKQSKFYFKPEYCLINLLYSITGYLAVLKILKSILLTFFSVFCFPFWGVLLRLVYLF